MIQQPKPKITLVGAGPGDPDLITRKGWKALESANVVLYDALANPALLEAAPAEARCIYVGKRAGQHSHSQESIQWMMVQHAFSHGHVVRLKGGDPFVFGRGHEELEFARAFHIETEIIPGISSSLAVPALQGIPLTRRGVNESFWVLTGTTKSGKLSQDLELAAQSTATVVILMGIRKLPQIAELFCQAGQGERSAMIIQNGSRPEERFVLGSIRDLPAIAEAANIRSPGIIVVGEVVELHAQFQSTILPPTKKAIA